MDLKKVFLKDACPTKMGGQAVLDGIMMKGEDRTALAVRTGEDKIYIKTTKNKKHSKFAKLPLVRGVVTFVLSLVEGTGTLMTSAEILEKYSDDFQAEEPGRFEKWIGEKFGDRALWNILLYSSVVFALVFSVGVFVLLPTWLVNVLSKVTENGIILNLSEGVLRILMFIGYVLLISKMNDIKNVFRYHGAEHKCIHCFENGLELTPENCGKFYTLHPRCGTSFLMFVLVISLILFSFLGWPSLAMRILSRILLIPVVAGISYEVLRWAGRSDNIVVRILSVPGLYLQKITTAEPGREQLEVAIASIKAVLVPEDTPCIEGFCDKEGKLIDEDDPLLEKAEEEKE